MLTTIRVMYDNRRTFFIFEKTIALPFTPHPGVIIDIGGINIDTVRNVSEDVIMTVLCG